MVRLSSWQWGPDLHLLLQLQPRAPRHKDGKGLVVVRGPINVQKSHSLTCRFEFLQRAATAAFPPILGPPSPTGTFQLLLLLLCALALSLAGEDGLLGLGSRAIPV